MRLMLLVFASIWAVSGCASKPVEPDWVAGNSTKYPGARYLVGRGQADTPAQARDRARADLAKVFQVAIEEISEDVVAFDSVGPQSGVTTQVRRAVSARTDQIIEGVAIAEQWHAPESTTYHALAVLDRVQAAIRLRATIRSLDDTTDAYIAAARQNPDLIGKAGAAQRSITAQLERRGFQRVLRIVDPSGFGEPERYNLAELVKDRDALLRRLKLRTQMAGDTLGGVEATLAGATAAAGFAPASVAEANYLLLGRFAHTQFKDAHGWYWLRGTLEIALLTQPANEARGNHRWEIKVSAQDEGSIEQRARTALQELLAQQLRSTLLGFGQAD